MAGLITLAFAFLSPIGLSAFFEMVDRAERERKGTRERLEEKARIKNQAQQRESIRDAFESAAKWRRQWGPVTSVGDFSRPFTDTFLDLNVGVAFQR